MTSEKLKFVLEQMNTGRISQKQAVDMVGMDNLYVLSEGLLDKIFGGNKRKAVPPQAPQAPPAAALETQTAASVATPSPSTISVQGERPFSGALEQAHMAYDLAAERIRKLHPIVPIYVSKTLRGMDPKNIRSLAAGEIGDGEEVRPSFTSTLYDPPPDHPLQQVPPDLRHGLAQAVAKVISRLPSPSAPLPLPQLTRATLTSPGPEQGSRSSNEVPAVRTTDQFPGGLPMKLKPTDPYEQARYDGLFNQPVSKVPPPDTAEGYDRVVAPEDDGPIHPDDDPIHPLDRRRRTAQNESYKGPVFLNPHGLTPKDFKMGYRLLMRE